MGPEPGTRSIHRRCLTKSWDPFLLSFTVPLGVSSVGILEFWTWCSHPDEGTDSGPYLPPSLRLESPTDGVDASRPTRECTRSEEGTCDTCRSRLGSRVTASLSA